MLVTITGAYRNAGDHLIGDRARSLLNAFVDSDIVNVDRRQITDESYELFNNARAVLLCGGPAYQKEMYPTIYPIELDRIKTKVIPFGLGWKGALDSSPHDFEFTPEASHFIREVHKRIELSSVRDNLTLDVVQDLGIKNVSLTGCPAWYDLRHITRDYEHLAKPKRIVYSLPAKPQKNVLATIAGISRMFPFAKKTLAFHHGWQPSESKVGLEMKAWHSKVFRFALLRGWGYADLAGGLDKFADLYTAADLHIGYRVHAHLYSLSQQSASILISEDSRGQGQIQTLGGPELTSKTPAKEILDAIEAHYDTRGATVAASVNTIHKSFEKMTDFLATI